MKNIFLKKAVSLVLALAVIISSLTVMMSAFAEPKQSGDPYIITDASPALPMFENKVVDLSKVKVELADGTQVAATDMQWEVTKGTNVTIDNNTLVSTETGTTVFKATYNEESKNIYVIVNKAGDYDFVLEKRDLTTEYVKAEWPYTGTLFTQATMPRAVFNSMLVPRNGYTGMANGGDFAFANANGINFTSGYFRTFAYMYDSKILKDFADYTLDATILSKVNGYYNQKPQLHFITRATLDDAEGTTRLLAQDQVSLGLGLYADGGVNVYKMGETEATSLVGDPLKTVHSLDDATLISTSTTDVSYIWDERKEGNADKVRHIVIELDGNRIVYKLDGNEILDTNKVIKNGEETVTPDAYNTFMDDVDTKKGTFGIVSEGVKLQFQAFKVSLAGVTADTMPGMTDVGSEPTPPPVDTFTGYTVTDGSPAIPMFRGKVVDLTKVRIEFADGTKVMATDVTWEQTSGDNVEKTGNTLVSGSVGTSVFTVTYEGKSKNIYVIVNKDGDYDFVIEKKDLKTEYSLGDWSFHINMYAYETMPRAVFNSMLAPKNSYGNIANGNKFFTADGDGMHFTSGYFRVYTWMYESKVLKDFADYDVNLTIFTEKNVYYQQKPQLHVITRATLDDGTTRLFAQDQKALGLGIYSEGGLHVYGIGEDEAVSLTGNHLQTVHSLDDASYLAKATTTDNKFILDETASGNSRKVRNLYMSLKGNHLSYKLDDNVIFDSDKAIKNFNDGSTITPEDYDKFMDKYYSKGTIGVVSEGHQVTVQGFKVSLAAMSADTMPTMTDDPNAPATYPEDDKDPSGSEDDKKPGGSEDDKTPSGSDDNKQPSGSDDNNTNGNNNNNNNNTNNNNNNNSDNSNQDNDTQQNAGDVDDDSGTTTLFGTEVDDLTLIIIAGIGALMLLLLLVGAAIVIFVVKMDSNNADDDDESDED